MTNYRPHIDGLRALAILLVLFHHLGDWFGMGGGYVGVDVFFVISGYLITGIVRREIEASRFSLGNFYRRRVIRLAPAYFLVLLATSVAAVIWMLPAELMEFAKSAGASSLLLSNFFMWKEVGGYFGQEAETIPLLHLWSLAVEEQFYLFWPIALIASHRLFGGRSKWLVLLVFICGVAISHWGAVRYPAAAYYLLPTRVFELAAGAVLAYWPPDGSSEVRPNGLPLLGLLLVLYGAQVYGEETIFPGLPALIPVAGTMLLIRWGDHGPISRVLASGTAIWIGRISYPMYLWHWPILSFLELHRVEISLPVGFLVLGTTIALSWATHRFFELPARRFLQSPPWTVVAAGAAVPMALSVVAATLVVLLQGFPARFPSSLNARSEALLSFPNKLRGRCNQGPPTAPLPPEKCILGHGSGPVGLLLVGDSHANHWTGFVDELGRAAKLRGYDVTQPNTPFLPGVDRWVLRDGEPVHYRDFVARNQVISEMIRTRRFRVIVLAGAFGTLHGDELLKMGHEAGTAAFEAGMRAALREATDSGAQVIVIESVPALLEGMHDCTLRAERFGDPLECTLPAKLHASKTAGIDEYFARLRGEFPEVVFVDTEVLICASGRCATELDGVPLYRDVSHLNDYGSRLLARIWTRVYGNPLDRARLSHEVDAKVTKRVDHVGG